MLGESPANKHSLFEAFVLLEGLERGCSESGGGLSEELFETFCKLNETWQSRMQSICEV